MLKYSKLISLYNFLQKYNPKYSSLILKIANYEKKYKKILLEKTKNRNMPFEDLFQGADRIYEDFNPRYEALQGDREVELILNEYGYKIFDYQKGLATPPAYSKNKSPIKIVKAINKIKDKIGLNILTKKENNLPYIFEVNKWNRAIFAINQFNNSTLRATKKERKNDLQIVYTRDTHDMARSSYKRDWTSCLNLNNEFGFNCVVDEIMSGGIIAYLIKKEDRDIKEPLSRVQIRRFKSKSTGDIKMFPELIEYGITNKDFLMQVKEFADRYNKDLDEKYKLLGVVSQSDSFDNFSDVDLNDFSENFEQHLGNTTKRRQTPDAIFNASIHIMHTLNALTVEELFDLVLNQNMKKYFDINKIRKNYKLYRTITMQTLFSATQTIKEKLNSKEMVKKYKDEILHVTSNKELMEEHLVTIELYNQLLPLYLRFLDDQSALHKLLNEEVLSEQSDIIRNTNTLDLIPDIDDLSAVSNLFLNEEKLSPASIILLINTVTQSKERTIQLLKGGKPTEREMAQMEKAINIKADDGDIFNYLIEEIANSTDPDLPVANDILKLLYTNEKHLESLITHISEEILKYSYTFQNMLNLDINLIREIAKNRDVRPEAKIIINYLQKLHI